MVPPMQQAPGGGQNQTPLAETLRTTTKPIHNRLNRLIVRRVPLALPPRANDPSVYLSGLLHIAPIYMTFEALWEDIIALFDDGSESSYDAASSEADDGVGYIGPIPLDKFKKPALPRELGLVLSKLFLPGLGRTQAFRHDLERLTGWDQAELDAEIRRLVTSDSPLGRFTGHIREAVERRPHVLISYAYILYMALFAGGRFIRSSLESAGTEFWAMTPVTPTWIGETTCQKDLTDGGLTKDPTSGEKSRGADSSSVRIRAPGQTLSPPVSFLRFETPSDGEDLKDEFKKRLLDSESLLTDGERIEIVLEATVIFEEMLAVVLQLDKLFEPDKPSDAISDATSSLAAQGLRPSGRLNDDMIVTNEQREGIAVQDDRNAPPDLLSVPDEEEMGGRHAESTSRATRIPDDPEDVSTPVTEFPQKTDPDPVTIGFDGTEDGGGRKDGEDGGSKEQAEGQQADEQDKADKADKEEEEEEEEEGEPSTLHAALMVLSRLIALASFTWLVICLTAMILGRAEPFKRGCPQYNPYIQ